MGKRMKNCRSGRWQVVTKPCVSRHGLKKGHSVGPLRPFCSHPSRLSAIWGTFFQPVRLLISPASKIDPHERDRDLEKKATLANEKGRKNVRPYLIPEIGTNKDSAIIFLNLVTLSRRNWKKARGHQWRRKEEGNAFEGQKGFRFLTSLAEKKILHAWFRFVSSRGGKKCWQWHTSFSWQEIRWKWNLCVLFLINLIRWRKILCSCTFCIHVSRMVRANISLFFLF